MPWLRFDDNAGMHPKVLALGATPTERNRAVGVWVRLLLYAAQYRTDGYLPPGAVDAISPHPDDLAGLKRVRILHTQASRCVCRDGRPWPQDAQYLLHDFLVYNPSRAENDVARAQRRELRDPALRRAVYDRDYDQCRYCGTAVNRADRKSPAGAVLDHVDPAVASGADNLVTACRACNSRKQKRTPDEAGMTLHPVPGAATSRSGPAAESHAESNAGSQTGDRSGSDPGADPHPNHGTSLRDTGINDEIRIATTHGSGRAGMGLIRAGDAGSAGHRAHHGPAPDPRRNAGPNPYLRAGHRDPDQHDPDHPTPRRGGAPSAHAPV